MSNAPPTSLPPGHAAKLAVLLDAVDSVSPTEGDRTVASGSCRRGRTDLE